MKRFAATLTMLALAPALSMTLAGCGGDSDTDLAEGDATGEVLPGSVSDAMIPLDQLRSQAAADPEGTSVSSDDETASDGEASDPDEVPTAPGPPPPAPATGGAPSPAATATARPSPPKAPAKSPAKSPAKATSTAAPPPPVSVLPTKTPSED